MAFSGFLQRHGVLLYVLVDFRLRHLPLIEVIESFREGEVVGLGILAFVVEQELADVFAVSRAIVVAKERKTLPFPGETRTKQRAKVSASLGPAFHQRGNFLFDVSS